MQGDVLGSRGLETAGVGVVDLRDDGGPPSSGDLDIGLREVAPLEQQRHTAGLRAGMGHAVCKNRLTRYSQNEFT